MSEFVAFVFFLGLACALIESRKTMTTEERVTALEIKAELLERMVSAYEAAFMRIGQFFDEVKASAEKVNKVE